MTEENKDLNEFISDEPVVEAPTPESAPPEPTPDTPPEPTPPEPAPEPTVTTPSEVPPVPPAPSAPSGEAPLEAEPPVQKTAEELWREEKEALVRQIEEMSARLVTQPAAPAPQPEAPKPAEMVPDGKGGVVAPAPTEPQVISFVKDDADFDAVLRSPEAYNKHLTGVLYKSVETVYRTIPTLVSRLADQQITSRLAVQEFYNNNKDLIANKAFVGMVANEISAKNPNWTLSQVMEKLGGEVRSRLKMGSGGAPPAAPPSGSPPAFVPNRGGGKPPATKQQSTMQDEILDFITDKE